MLNFNSFKKIIICADECKFAGGIDSFQIRIYSHFKDDEIINTLFVFSNKSKRQLKLYFETEKGSWLTQYRIRKGNFSFPTHDGHFYKVDKRQLLWILDGLNFIKETQKYK